MQSDMMGAEEALLGPLTPVRMPCPIDLLAKPNTVPFIFGTQSSASFNFAHGLANFPILFMDPPESSPPINRLSVELLAIVFEHLRDVDSLSLLRARRTCKVFNDLITPIFYETITLNRRLVEGTPAVEYRAAFQNVVKLTRNVVISSKLCPLGVRLLLQRMERVSSIRYIFVQGGTGLRSMDRWFPISLIYPELPQLKNTKLYVENLEMQQYERWPPLESYEQAIPSHMLVSLTMANPTPPLTTKLPALKKLLLRSRRLEVLRYLDRGQGTQFQFDTNERMPSMRELSLVSYDWDHSVREVDEHWDFSKLEHLELVKVPSFNFLQSVPFRELANLRVLHVEDYSAHRADFRLEATQKLHDLVRNHIKALECLEITCHTRKFGLDGLFQHRSTLQKLKFRDHVGFEDETVLCPTLHHDQLNRLAIGLHQLRQLELDMDSSMCDSRAFLQTLARFPKLTRLTVHVQTVLSCHDPLDETCDSDYEAATNTLFHLVDGRKEADPNLHWQEITINVGGWRRVQVRRLSPVWRARNEKGIFAERCFVMQRDEDGQYGIREEMSVESLSARATPERQ